MASFQELDHLEDIRGLEKLYSGDKLSKDDLRFFLLDAILSRNPFLFMAICHLGKIDPRPLYNQLSLLDNPDPLTGVDILYVVTQSIPKTYEFLTCFLPPCTRHTEFEKIIEVGMRVVGDTRQRLLSGAVTILQTSSGLNLRDVPQQANDILRGRNVDKVTGVASRSLLFRHQLLQLLRLNCYLPIAKFGRYQKEFGTDFITSDVFCLNVGSYLSIRDLMPLAPVLRDMVEAQYRMRIEEVLSLLFLIPRLVRQLWEWELINQLDMELLIRQALLARNTNLMLTCMSLASPDLILKCINWVSVVVPSSSLLSLTDLAACLALYRKQGRESPEVDLSLVESKLPLTNSNQTWFQTMRYPAITNLESMIRNLAYVQAANSQDNFHTLQYNYRLAVHGGVVNHKPTVLNYRLTKLQQLFYHTQF